MCGMYAAPDRVFGLGTYHKERERRPDLLCCRDGEDKWHSVLDEDTRAQAVSLVAVLFGDSGVGIAVGGRDQEGTVVPLILRTGDGRSSWTIVDAPLLDGGKWYGWKVQFLGPADVFIALSNYDKAGHGYLLHSADSGQTWEAIKVCNSGLSQINLLGVGMRSWTPSSRCGWVGSSGASLYTADGGASWEVCLELKRANRFQMFDTCGYAVGAREDEPVYRLSYE